ncbi:MAG TPA: S4 domain-containing protein [bacterium]|nr:S4 domain-containing protein [bacterium]
MRLDKFLQVTRLVRRRALANSLCHAGRATVNGQAARPSATIRTGDVVAVKIGDRRIRARVLAVPEVRRRNEDDLIEILEDVEEATEG